MYSRKTLEGVWEHDYVLGKGAPWEKTPLPEQEDFETVGNSNKNAKPHFTLRFEAKTGNVKLEGPPNRDYFLERVEEDGLGSMGYWDKKNLAKHINCGLVDHQEIVNAQSRYKQRNF